MHQHNHPKRKSIFHTVVWFLSIYILVPLTAIVVATIFYNVQNAKKALLEQSSVYFDDMAQVCKNHLASIDDLVTILQDSSAIRDQLNNLNISTISEAPVAQPISDIIAMPFTYKNCFKNFSVHAVGIYFRDNLIFYTLRENGVDLALERMKSIYTLNKDISYPDGRFIAVSAEQTSYAYFFKDFKNIYNGRYYGKIVIEVSPIPSNVATTEGNYLPASDTSLNLNAHPSTQYYLYNNDKTVIFSSDVTNIGQNISSKILNDVNSSLAQQLKISNNHTIIYQSSLKNTDLTLLAETEQKEFNPKINPLSTIIFLVSLFLYFIVLALVLRNFNNPLKQVSAYCRSALQYEKAIPPTFEPSYNEINDIYDLFSRYTKSIETLEDRSRQAEKEHREDQIRNLQAQMNPHFLFNMLDIIGWKAENSQSKEIQSMINHLSEILRYSIKQNQPKITLQQELVYIRQYLSLQLLGNSNKFSYTINADDYLLNQYYIPKLVLQPLVENAIVHGILPSNRIGEIQINIWEELDGIMCQIKDNGVGFDSSKAFEPIDKQVDRHNRVALYNIRERLNMIYGEPYGLKITSTRGQGTVATVYIPFDPVPENGGSDNV